MKPCTATAPTTSSTRIFFSMKSPTVGTMSALAIAIRYASVGAYTSAPADTLITPARPPDTVQNGSPRDREVARP